MPKALCSLLAAVLLFFLFNAAQGVMPIDIKKGKVLAQNDAKDLVENLIIMDRLPEMDALISKYSECFRDVDLGRAYYEAGVGFYLEKNRMLALKAFMKGFSAYGEGGRKPECGYYIARILYADNNRDSALFYINRVLEKLAKNPTDSADLLDMAEKLKRRIRWDYISRFEGLPDESISDIEFDGDDVWISMWTGGVARFTRSSRTMELFNPDNSGLISIHTRDSKVFKHKVWIGTYEGLSVYHKKIGKWENIREIGSVSVKKLRQIGDKLYAATLGRGLFVYDWNTDVWSGFFDDAPNVTDVTDAGGRLYISTLDNGLYCYDNGAFSHYLGKTPVKCLLYLDGRIYAGTHGQGILVLGTNNVLQTNFTTRNGLPSDFVETLEPVKKNILIGTLGGGVGVYNTADQGIHSLSVLDGLPSNDVVRISVEKNRIWFGTLSGGIGIMLTENLDDI